MREIKFRAYHRTNKTMYFFDLMWGNFKSGGGYIGMSETNDWSTRTFVDPHECDIMQYTGLKDKNRVEIYERDIVDNDWRERRDKIHFAYGSFLAGDYKLALSECMDCEVIGNIHQNPELL